MALQVLLKFQCFVMLLWNLASAEILSTGSQVISKPGCRDRCGNVSIPYPFGIGPGCFLDKYFEIRCDESLLNSIKPVYGPNYNISNISILGGDMTTEIFIARDCPDNEIPNFYSTAGFTKFTFSDTKNKFIGMGCNTWAYQKPDGNRSISTGCLSVCDNIEDSTDGSCTGVGCCQAPVPSGLRRLNFSVGSMTNTGRKLGINPCSYAFFIEEKSFNFSSSYFKDFKNNGTGSVPVVVDWTVGFETCDEAARNRTTYACGPNTDCIEPEDKNILGYRCNCTRGYRGNPYLNSSASGGCRDIDECEELGVCSGDSGTCTNREGSYGCSCKKGYDIKFSNDIIDCVLDSHSTQDNNNLNKIVVGVCLGLFLLLVSLVAGLWIYWGYKKRKHMELREEFFKKNGGLILNQLLDEREDDIEATKNIKGEKKHRSIAKIYTEQELTTATNNYHESQILGRGGFGTVYKGTLSNGEVVAIKKTKIVDLNQNEQFINEIAVLSQINHKNVVQLLGCCLESEVPLLVYEYVANGTLHQHLHEQHEGSTTLSWENRLRIASEVAGSLAYLHSEASIPIIHRDIKSGNVLLDEDYKAKVADFGGSRLNPTDEAQLCTVVQGTFGYLDPEYMQSSQLTDKSDVYSFGVLLVELLTGKAVFSPHRLEEERNLASYFLSSMKTNRLFAILDERLVQNDMERVSSVHGHQQIQEVAELAQKCLRMKGENRPSMKEVAIVLHGITRVSSNHPWALDDEDTTNTSSKEEYRRLLLESAELLSYTDSISTIGDSSKGISAFQTEGR